MKTLILAMVLLMSFLGSSYSQLTTEYPFKTWVDGSGNLFVTGSRTVSGNKEILIKKYSSTGSPLVDGYYSNSGDDMGLDIKADNDYIYITGYLYNGSTSSNDIAILAYDLSNSTFSWTHTYGSSLDDRGYSLVLDGTYLYVGGCYQSTATKGNTGKDFEILKYSTSGTLQWATEYNIAGNTGDDIATKILVDAGYVYAVGYEYNSSSSSNNIVFTNFLKSDGSLSQKIELTAGNETKEPTGFILLNPSRNNVVKSRGALVGFTQFTNSIAIGYERNYITAFFDVGVDGSSYLSWVDTFATAGQDVATGVVSNANNDIIVTGYSENGTHGYDFATIKYEGSDGTQDWIQYYDNSNGDDKASGITIDNTGEIVVSGYSENSTNQYVVEKYTDNSTYAQEVWSRTFLPSFFSLSQPSYTYNYATWAGVDSMDNVYVLAFDWNSGGGAYYSAIKYDTAGTVVYTLEDTTADRLNGVINNSAFKLNQNFPNPFNPSTNINYEIPFAGYVTLKVYDLIGKEIASLVNISQNPGSYRVNFDASSLASGIYLYKLTAVSGSTKFEKVQKMVLIK